MVNGWFPRINVDGVIASGNAGIWLTPPDGTPPRQVSPVGTSPVWAARTLVFNRDDGTTQVGDAVVPLAYNAYVGADDGRWAGFDARGDGRVDLYAGTTRVDSIPNACGPRFGDGHFAYLTPYQPGPDGFRALIVDGVRTAEGAILDVVLGAEEICWQVATGTYTRALLTTTGPVQIRDDEAPLGLFRAPDGAPWIVTATPTVGTLIRPLRGHEGYVIEGDLYYPDARMIGGRLRVVGSLVNGTPRFDVWIDFTAPRRDLRTLGSPAPSPIPTPPPVPPPPGPPPAPPPGPPSPVPPPEPPMPDLPEPDKTQVCDAIGVIAAAAFPPQTLVEASQGVRQALDQGVTDLASLVLLSRARAGGATPEQVEAAAAAARRLLHR